MLDALSWFFAIEALGLLAFPVAFALFRHLPDRGYTLAKPAALVFFSYILWLLGFTQVVPNTQWTIAAILCAGAGIAVLLAWRQATGIRQFLKTNWRTLVAAEIVFIVFFGLWLWTVSEAPAINHTEKPMDFGFLNAVLQSRFFPPEDPWLAGSPVSYYYFGHFMMAFITHLTGVASSVGYNLGVAVVPALAAAGAFGLVYNLARMSGATVKTGLVFGAAAPLLVLLAGNLEGALEFVKTQDWAGDGFWAWVGIKGLEGPADAGGGFPDGYWWWFRASRVIDTLVDGQSLDYTITEFPMFSFILGDLHPHVTSLPFVFLGLGLALNLYRSPDSLGLRWLRRHPWQVLGLGLFLGALAFINTWDLPTMAALLGAVMLLKAWRDEEGDLGRAALTAGAVFTPVVALSVVFFVPFYLDLDSQASGILPLTGVATRPFLLFLVMGLFLVLTLAFIFRQAFELPRSSPGEPSAASLVVVVALAPILLWLAAASLVSLAADGVGAALDDIGRRAVLAVPGAIIVGAAGFCAFRRARWGPDPAAFVLTLTALGFFLLMGTELYYVVDSFGGAYRRMNTVFKTYYQAWWLLESRVPTPFTTSGPIPSPSTAHRDRPGCAPWRTGARPQPRRAAIWERASWRCCWPLLSITRWGRWSSGPGSLDPTTLSPTTRWTAWPSCANPYPENTPPSLGCGMRRPEAGSSRLWATTIPNTAAYLPAPACPRSWDGRGTNSSGEDRRPLSQAGKRRCDEFTPLTILLR